MTTKGKIIISFLLMVFFCNAQKVSGVYKINDLLTRIDKTNDTVYVVNFWATWCVPCVQELPEIDSFAVAHKNDKIKVLLVSLDFKEDLEKKVNPFLKKHNYSMECVLLDEINGNDYINKVDVKWSGSIPATLITISNRKHSFFIEKKIKVRDLNEAMNRMH